MSDYEDKLYKKGTATYRSKEMTMTRIEFADNGAYTYYSACGKNFTSVQKMMHYIDDDWIN